MCIQYQSLISLSVLFHLSCIRSVVAFIGGDFSYQPKRVGKYGKALQSSPGFQDAFVTQKNYILFERLRDTNTGGNLTEKAREYLNFCDESFNNFLDQKVAEAANDEEKKLLGKIRYEINVAKRNRLIEADIILRDILSGGGLKQMEGKLNGYLRRGEIDMAFMVILQLNIEDALNSNVTTAVQIMKHLETLITEFQDTLVSAPVHLVRLLARENDTNIRKQMLRQKLLLPKNIENILDSSSSTPEGLPKEAQATLSPQCEHIIVQPVMKWGGADVTVEEFLATIEDVVSQMTGLGGDEQSLTEIENKCAQLRNELHDVLSETNNCQDGEKCSNQSLISETAANNNNTASRNDGNDGNDDGSFVLM